MTSATTLSAFSVFKVSLIIFCPQTDIASAAVPELPVYT